MTIASQFAQDAKLLNELLFLLTREQVSLINMDIDAIELMLEEKSDLLRKIGASAQNRYRTLAQEGFEPNENGMSSWIICDAEPSLAREWDDFQTLLAQAKELNRLNGQLIAKHFQRNQHIINQLQSHAFGTTVYGRNGQTSSIGHTSSVLAV